MNLRRTLTGAGVAGLLVASVFVAPGMAPADAKATPGHDVRKVTTTNFADPGLTKAGSYYYIYRTGKGFAYSRSTSPDKGFSKPRAAMTATIPWAGKRKDNGQVHYWAPSVSRVGKQYVMYFTASKKGGYDCIGVATSSKPYGFKPKSKPLMCSSSATIIDPSLFVTSKGTKVVLYKHRSMSGKKLSRIDRLTLNSSGTARKSGARPVTVISARSVTVEAPDAIRHNGKVWLFVSRKNYADCSYYTEVWSAASINKKFTSRGELVTRTRKNTAFCGEGGLEVIKDGSATRIAFHAWVGGTEKTGGKRMTWTGRLGWSKKTGRPYVVRIRR